MYYDDDDYPLYNTRHIHINIITMILTIIQIVNPGPRADAARRRLLPYSIIYVYIYIHIICIYIYIYIYIPRGPHGPIKWDRSYFQTKQS